MLYLAYVVIADIPVSAVSNVKSSPVLLYNYARHHVLEGLAEVVKLLHTSVTYRVNPVRNLDRRKAKTIQAMVRVG